MSKLGQKQQRYTRFCSEFKLPQIMNHNSWHIGDDSTNAICPHNFDHLTWIDTLRIDSDTLRVIGVLRMSKSRQKWGKYSPFCGASLWHLAVQCWLISLCYFSSKHLSTCPHLILKDHIVTLYKRFGVDWGIFFEVLSPNWNASSCCTKSPTMNV